MRTRILTLFMVAMMLPMLATVASAQDESYILVNGSGAFALDENNDGDLDLVRVIASIVTTAPSAGVGVEVIADNGDMAISFWNNTSIGYDESFIANTTVKAWEDGEYQITLRVWDLESGLMIHDEDLGLHELMASLTPPQLSMELESEEWIFTGDTCLGLRCGRAEDRINPTRLTRPAGSLRRRDRCDRSRHRVVIPWPGTSIDLHDQ